MNPSSFLTATPMKVEWLNSQEFITAIGCNLAIGSIRSPDQFQFLEGHSQIISAFCIDQNRKLCASGQVGKESHSELSTPVIVWDLSTRSQLVVLRGHKSKISHLTFSEDGRLLAVADDVSKNLWIWDLQEQDLGCYIGIPAPVSTLKFGGLYNEKWILHATCNTQLLEFTITFDPRTFEYKTTTKSYVNPTNGYRRTYDSCTFLSPNYIVGSHAGEVTIYNAQSATVRANVQVDSFSISDICDSGLPDSVIAVGRQFSLVSGVDTNWSIKKQTTFEQPIISVSCLDGKALVRLADTTISLIDIKTFSRTNLVEGVHYSPNCIAATNDTVAVGLGEHGLVIIDLDAGHLSVTQYIPDVQACSVAATPLGEFVAGCINGTIAVVNSNGNVIWRSEHLHRGRVSSVCVTPEFIATGGQDGYIRVITHKTKTLVQEILAHNGEIYQIIPSTEHPERVHSVSDDRTINTTDVATGKRICQQLTSGRVNYESIAQFGDGENEIIVGMGNGTIHGYDWPRQGIVLEEKWPCGLEINAIAIRGKTRDFVAVAGESEYIGFCNFNTGKWTQSGVAHSTTVHDVCFTPDGKYLLSAANDGVCLWNL